MTWPTVYGGGPNPNLASSTQMAFSSMLAAIYRSDQPLYDQDESYRRDPDAWAKMMRDPIIRSLVEQRLAAVARQEWHVEPGDDSQAAKRVASIVEQLLRKITSFEASRRHLAKCIFLGYVPAWIEGARRVLAVRDGDVPAIGEWWTPTYLRPLDKRQFRFVSSPLTGDGGALSPRVRAEIWFAGRNQWETVRHPECLLLPVYDDDPSRLGYGRGLAEAMYAYHWLKGMVLEIGLSGFEKYANGVLVGKVANAQQAQPGRDNATVAAAMLSTLAKMRSEGVVVVDKEDDVSIVHPGNAGQDATAAWLAYFDDALARLILGSVLPSGGGQGVGSLARAEVEQSSTDAIYDADRALLDEELTSRLVSLVVELNEPMWTRLGLLGAPCPRFSSRSEQRLTPSVILDNIAKAQAVGMQISREDAHQLTGFPMPEPGDDILSAPKPEPSAGGFGGLGGASPFDAASGLDLPGDAEPAKAGA